MRSVLLLLLLSCLFACSAVTVRTDKNKKLRHAPDYQKRFNYYWWGLKGEHKVNVRLVCNSRDVEQMQVVDTAGDILLTLVTVGIYAPRTARVWCREGIENE